MYKPSDITLYIPFYNADNTISECLEGVFSQSIAPAEIVIVDDGSTRPCVEPRARVVRHAENRGLAAARNTALQYCGTSLVAALDSDVRPEVNWLRELLAVINTGKYAGVGGMMTETCCRTLGDKWRKIHMSQHWGLELVENPKFLYGANTLFNANILKQTGGYDEQHRTNDEDRQISETLYDAGHCLCYTPKATCGHLRSDTAESILPGYWRWHHMKGVKRGDFLSPNGIAGRIKDVNFGISCYRTELDKKKNRVDLLALDSAIPWVFCALDLRLFACFTNQTPRELPLEIFSDGFCDPAKIVLHHLVKTAGRAGISGSFKPAHVDSTNIDSDWFDAYMEEFMAALREYPGKTGFNPYEDSELWMPISSELFPQPFRE